MGIDADSLSSESRSPLMYACKLQRLDTMRLLYERGARVAFSESHDTLMEACEEGHTKVLSTLFEMPELNLQWRRSFKSTYFDPWKTVVLDTSYFHHAAYNCRAGVSDWLIQVGLVQDVNRGVGDDGFTALYLAASGKNSYKKTLPLLLSKGADVSSKCTTHHSTALHAAARNGLVKNIEVLLSHAADPSATDSKLRTPYVTALEADMPLAAQRLLNYVTAQKNEDKLLQMKGEIGPIDLLSMGRSLHRSAEVGLVDMVQTLLDNGADVNSRSAQRTTAAMRASRGGHLEVLDLLKMRGANFKARDSEGKSALTYACTGLKSLVVPGLLELGLKFTEASYYDATPLHDCVLGRFNQEFHDVVMAHTIPNELSSYQLAKLLNYGSLSEDATMIKWILSLMDTAQKKDAINNVNYAVPSFALHQASFEGSVEKLEILLDAGGEIDLRNEKIDPPLACAASMDRMEAVQFLAKKGASFEYSMPDGTKGNAIDAAKNYPKIQQWMRDFYEDKKQGMEAECADSDERGSLGTIEGDVSEAAGV